MRRFKPLTDLVDVNRVLTQPLLIMPFLTEELMSRLPANLKMLNQEDDGANLDTYVNDLLIKQTLCQLYLGNTASHPGVSRISRVDYGPIT